ncbi:MAG: type III-B CRISPR-associated protein Cas10/Cmr2 [Porphyromonas sp.]|nr:type III-B CRISPR-associated protein Cas10/Cmr2 [Porphyromonas sp.]
MIYTAITIGPICKTLSKARNTKSFWSASFMFSWIMRELLERVPKKEGIEIRSPYYSSDINTPKGVGLFPDRAFIEGEVEGFDNIKNEVLEELAKKFQGAEDILPYLKEYISISHIQVDCQDQAGIFFELNQYLDTQELRQKAATSSLDCISDFLKGNNCFIRDEFEGRPFASISEIAVSGWLTHDEVLKYLNGKQEVDYQRISKERDDFLNCYKYMAIVKADGDNFGSFIKELSSKDMEKFSRSFFEFSTDITQKIEAAKAVPIYIGGDDLFFFAPILENGEKDVFDLINTIDGCFKKFWENLKTEKNLSMSYGVSIFYYKSPMSEAMDVATKMLFERAKKCEDKDKDRVAVSIRKHSGRTIEFLLPRKGTTNGNSDLYKQARTLMKELKEDEAMIDGFVHWLDEMYDSVIEPILMEEEDLRKKRLEALRKNFFNEDIHKEKETFLKKIFDFIYQTTLSNDVIFLEKEERKKMLYGILRYCQFITDKEER